LEPSLRSPGPRTCGCASPARWRCERCSANGQDYLGCSRRCLERHRRGSHGEQGGWSIAAWARREQANRNALGDRNWESFASHRDRITRLLRAVQRGEGLCVLGAGNGDDLDLPALVREFGELHLVDLDGAALARARARVPPTIARRVVLHGDVDLTGLLDQVDRWAEDDGALADAAAGAAAAIAARLGQTFDVVLSSCVLSQLCSPFAAVLARRGPEWLTLMRLVGGSHFELMARLLRPGGCGVALGDGYHGPVAERASETPTWQTLDPLVQAALSQGVMRLRDPAFLAEVIVSSPARDLIESARLSDPWLWQVEEAEMLVYAVIFQRT
jgi:SAM-dependent methyltransferase